MAITDGTPIPNTGTPSSTPNPETKPEIVLNLNFDNKTNPEPSKTSEKKTEEMNQEANLDDKKNIANEKEDTQPSFLKMNTPEANIPIEVTKLEETKKEENKQPTNTDMVTENWLAQEDALIQKTITTTNEKETTNKIETIENLGTQEETKTQVIPEQFPPQPINNNQTQNLPTSSLENDMNIIQNLTSNTVSAPIEKTTTAPQTQEQTNTINLDNLVQNVSQQTLSQNTGTNTPTQGEGLTNSQPPQTPINPIPYLTEEKKTKGTKILLFTLLFVSLGAVVFFILKTMYPVEMAGFISFPTGNETTNTQETLLPNEETPLTQDMTGAITGEILPNNAQQTTGEEINSTGQHGSADDAMFTDLEELSTQVNNAPESLISKLKVFIDQGSSIFEKAKTQNDKIGMKFGGYIRNKATSLVNSLESGEQLDTQMVQNYLAQFSGYLSQLQNSSNETNNQGSKEVSPSSGNTIYTELLSGQEGEFSNATGIFQTQ